MRQSAKTLTTTVIGSWPKPSWLSGGLHDTSGWAMERDWLFQGDDEPGCLAATNANGDAGGVDISDAIWVLDYLFTGGLPPVAPFPGCGVGSLEVDQELGCGAIPRGCQQ